MKDKSKLTAIILVIVTILVVVITFIINNNKKEKDENDIEIVKNASNFYTVNSCLYRTITYISSKDTESLMLLLTDEYKKNNEVTEENVLDVFFDTKESSSFVSEEMYFEEVSNDITKYYVKGHVEENKMDDEALLVKENFDSIYFIVYLDSSNNLFSIEPYDGKIFKEVN